MKANEFVKKVGWLKACDIVAHIPDRFMFPLACGFKENPFAKANSLIL